MDSIRRNIIQDPDLVKSLLLTPRQVGAVRTCITHGPQTSTTLAGHLCISFPHASQILGEIEIKGYVTKKSVPTPNNHWEYKYTIIENLIDDSHEKAMPGCMHENSRGPSVP